MVFAAMMMAVAGMIVAMRPRDFLRTQSRASGPMQKFGGALADADGFVCLSLSLGLAEPGPAARCR